MFTKYCIVICRDVKDCSTLKVYLGKQCKIHTIIPNKCQFQFQLTGLKFHSSRSALRSVSINLNIYRRIRVFWKRVKKINLVLAKEEREIYFYKNHKKGQNINLISDQPCINTGRKREKKKTKKAKKRRRKNYFSRKNNFKKRQKRVLTRMKKTNRL